MTCKRSRDGALLERAPGDIEWLGEAVHVTRTGAMTSKNMAHMPILESSAVWCDNHQAGNRVLELTYVARPIVPAKFGDRARTQPDPFGSVLDRLAPERFSEDWYIFKAIAKRRQRQTNGR